MKERKRTRVEKPNFSPVHVSCINGVSSRLAIMPDLNQIKSVNFCLSHFK